MLQARANWKGLGACPGKRSLAARDLAIWILFSSESARDVRLGDRRTLATAVVTGVISPRSNTEYPF